MCAFVLVCTRVYVQVEALDCESTADIVTSCESAAAIVTSCGHVFHAECCRQA